jgi:septal ring factor EnvC (AmiA/AmiB activator)
VLIGVAALSAIVSYRMDNYYKQISYLEHIIRDKDERLEKLEKSINTQSHIIKDIEVNLIFDKGGNNDEIDKMEIEKVIKEKYNTLLGKEVKSIDAHIVVEVVDKRILKIKSGEYKLQVDKLILTEIMSIWIKVMKTG